MKLSRIVIPLVIGLAVAIGSGLYKGSQSKTTTLTPEEKFDAALSTMPSFQVLKEQEPQFWAQLRTRAIAMEKEGKTEQQIIDTVQPEILGIQMARLQTAPDDQVVLYMKVNMEQTAAVQKVSDDDCFRFLFPAVKGGINPMRILPREMLQYRMSVDANMMRAAYGASKHTVTPQERAKAQQDLQPVVGKLVQKYGADIEMLSDPHKGVGKEKMACDMIEDLWNTVLTLPEADAAGIVRFAMASAAQ
nr:topoisomerase II [uncultured Enterobacter sp.]